jgi:crossover junction endodeoxyribonuclease RuvC
MRIILGIDPGLTKTGWGVIKVDSSVISYVASGTIKSSSDQNIFLRLNNLHKFITEVMSIYKPSEAAIEKTFVNKNPLSSLKLGQARGALMLSLSMRECLDVKEYASTEVKKAVVGVGRADKRQVSYMVKMILPRVNIKSEDEADALAVAICHVNSFKDRDV